MDKVKKQKQYKWLFIILTILVFAIIIGLVVTFILGLIAYSSHSELITTGSTNGDLWLMIIPLVILPNAIALGIIDFKTYWDYKFSKMEQEAIIEYKKANEEA